MLWKTCALILFIGTSLSGDEPCQDNDKVDFLEILEQTLNYNYDIFNTFQTVEIELGKWNQEKGIYDTNLNTLASREKDKEPTFLCDNPVCPDILPPPRRPAIIDKRFLTDVEWTMERHLRSGILLKSTVTLNRITDNLAFPRTQTRGITRLRIEFPLMQGYGYENFGANEIAQGFKYRAAFMQQRQDIAKVIANVAKEYWNYAYLRQRAEIYRLSVERLEKFLDDLRKLISAGEVAGTEIYQVLEDLHSKRQSYLRAFQDLFASKQKLLVFMALDPLEEEYLKIVVKDFPFPTLMDIHHFSKALQADWVKVALNRRDDYYATTLLVDSAAAALKGAYNQLEPKLNVGVEVGTNAIKGGRKSQSYRESFYHRARGLNGKIEFNFETPIYNIQQQGLVQTQFATLLQAQTNRAILHNQIESDVLTDMNAIYQGVLEHIELQKATDAAHQAIRDEFIKFQRGESSVFYVIQLENIYINAELNEVIQAAELIASIIDLRLNMGVILPSRDSICTLTEEDLILLPPFLI